MFQRIDFFADVNDLGAISVTVVLSKYFCANFAPLCTVSKTVRPRKIFVESIFITFWNICAALPRTRFDGRRVALTTVSATWEIRPLYNEWSSLWERGAWREYHESLCIPHRADWDTRTICIPSSKCDKYAWIIITDDS